MSKLVSNLQTNDKIGEGFFGEVFSGKDDIHDLVAIKILKKREDESLTDWKTRKVGLLKEAQNLKKAQHKNVVEVYHLLESDTDDAIQYVMEFCDGGSLLEAYQKAPASTATVKRIATDVTLGLSTLHNRGMLHRDVKPSNILRAGSIYKLGDFGLVTDDLLFGYGSATGYLDHLAPEVWAGNGTSVRTDIWALGMTLYRLLHGHIWYSASPAPRATVKHGGFANRLLWLPHVPKQWRRAVRSMLREDPKDRCQNTQQLQTLIAGLPTEPSWQCKVKESSIAWLRVSGHRRIRVIWMQNGRHDHQWEAWSEPTGEGRRRALGGSKGLTLSQARKELEDFFRD